jgi:hypothetical protein
MAANRGWALSGGVVLALVTAVPVGCSDGCGDLSCDPIAASVRTDLPDPLRITVCLDDDCRDLTDGRSIEGADVTGGFSGFGSESLPDENVHVRVAARDGSGNVLATFEDRRKPTNGCCGNYVAFRFDGEELRWVDG